MVKFKESIHCIDTNILVDYVQKRRPFYDSARKIFLLAERKEINLAITTLSFPTLYYLCRKSHSKEILQAISRNINNIVTVLSAQREAMNEVISTNFPDLEDAFQNYIAESNGCTSIITRNKRDFKKSNLAILTPEEFLATL